MITKRFLILAGCLAVAFLALAYPMYVIRPFRAQGAEELAIALAVRSWGPPAALAAAVAAVLVTILSWRVLRRALFRGLACVVSTLTVLFAALTQVNVFELMFHPIDSPAAIAASDAKLNGDDMVLAIRAGGHSRAYPIRMMGYHHIANDWVGGVPVVATY